MIIVILDPSPIIERQMNSEQAGKRIRQLTDELNRHNILYYVQARPQIPDREYDLLSRELEALEEAFPSLIQADSPTRRVGEQRTVPCAEGERDRHGDLRRGRLRGAAVHGQRHPRGERSRPKAGLQLPVVIKGENPWVSCCERKSAS